MAKFLDSNGLIYLWSKIKAIVPTKTSDLMNDSGYVTQAQIPEGAVASSTAPKMDGVAKVGTENAFARGDHVHPSDTTKVDKVEGKGLSTEDYTTAEKTKLAGIEEKANNYVLPTATGSVLGGVKTGSNIVNSSGLISVADGTTAAKGVVQMSDAVNSDVSTTAATSKAVKQAYDLANSKANKSTTLAGYGITDAYTKTELDAKLTSAVTYKGTVASYAELPTENQKVGDMYNVTAKDDAHSIKAGDNVVWNGESWDVQSGTVDLSSCVQVTDTITNGEIDEIAV